MGQPRLEWEREGIGIVSAVLYDEDDHSLLTGIGPDDETVLALMAEQAEHMDDGTLELFREATA